MKKYYIKYCRKKVYAIYYKDAKKIYYNLNFNGTTQLLLVI